MRSNAPLGIVAELQRRRASIVRGRDARPLIPPPPLPAPKMPIEPPPYYRTLQPAGTIARIMDVVCAQTDLGIHNLRGFGQTRRVVNARAVVAVLAEEFAPRLSARAVDDALMRGDGMTIWYRERFQDRCILYPGFRELYWRCRAALVEQGK